MQSRLFSQHVHSIYGLFHAASCKHGRGSQGLQARCHPGMIGLHYCQFVWPFGSRLPSVALWLSHTSVMCAAMSAFQRRVAPVEELIGSQPTSACKPAGSRKRISVDWGARIAEGEHVLRFCRGAMTADEFRHLQANPNARLPRDFWKNFLREEMQAAHSKETSDPSAES